MVYVLYIFLILLYFNISSLFGGLRERGVLQKQGSLGGIFDIKPLSALYGFPGIVVGRWVEKYVRNGMKKSGHSCECPLKRWLLFHL